MSFSTEDYMIAGEIFFKCLKTGYLKEEKEKALFLAYINNDGVREALTCLEKSARVSVKLIGSSIYLMPEIDNQILGLNFMNEPLLGENQSERYLSCLIMIIIFKEMTSRDFSYPIETISLIDLITESLNRSAEKDNIEQLEADSSFNVLSIKSIWESKLPWEEGNKNSVTRKTKLGAIRKVITFLKKQELIIEMTDEDKIIATSQLKDKMTGHFLDEERKDLIESLFI